MEFEEATKVKKSPQTIAMIKKIKRENRKKKFKKHKSKIIVLFTLIVFIIIILTSLNIFVFSIYKVDTNNMDNTLKIDDRVYVDKDFTKIDSGHVYQFKKDGNTLIDRCIGVGGDHIVVQNEKVFINYILVAENYVSSDGGDKINMEIVVPDGKLFFLGDNRNNSWDSRYWIDKFIDESDIVGEVTDIVYPFERSKKITYY